MRELSLIESYYAGKTYYELVKDFHSRFGHPVGDEGNPQPLNKQRQITRMEWMIEELVEFCAFDNLVNQVDAIIDCLYFVIGCFVESGNKTEVAYFHAGDRGELYPALPLALPNPARLAICKSVLKAIIVYGHSSTLDEQVIALTKIIELLMQAFAELGCDPRGLFELVHDSNMGKLWPDGTVKYDPVTGKILKSPIWEPPEPYLKKEILNRVKAYHAKEKEIDKEDEIPF